MCVARKHERSNTLDRLKQNSPGGWGLPGEQQLSCASTLDSSIPRKLPNVNTHLDTALSYAARGWAVFPLRPGEKIPQTAHGVKDATTDPDVIRAWWTITPSANIGLACGPSGLVVIDLDVKNGVDGIESWAALVGQHEINSVTVSSHTPSGGLHLFYRNSTGSVIGNSAGKLAPGVDIRGNGGYVVLPPSRNGEGGYQWDDDFSLDTLPMAELPQALVALLTKPEPKAQPVTETPVTPGLPYARAALRDELDNVRQAANGTRNDTLNRAAHSLGQLVGAGALDRGLVETELHSAALAVGLAERESMATIRSGLEAGLMQPRQLPERATVTTQPIDTAMPVVQQFRLTDIGNGERLAYYHGDKLRYVPQWGWLAYTGRKWERSDGEARRLAKDTVRIIYGEAAALSDDDKRKAVASWALRSESEGRLGAMLTMAQSETAIEAKPEWFDGNPMTLNVTNGTLDLHTGELYAHRACDLSTRLAGTHFDPSAQCPQWLAFLEKIFDGNQALIAFIRRAVGYSLTGETSEQCLLFCYGTGANGKSTFLETVRALLGDYGQQADFSTFLAGQDDAGARPDIARLAGVRFVSAIEAGEGKRLAEAVVKQLTGGDTVAARYLYKEHFEYKPSFKLWLAANHKPIIKGTDHAIWRRIRLIPFTVTIPEAEQDGTLPAKLKAELPGILAWALQGCLDWQANGLQTPGVVKEATATYRAEQDVIAAWLADCCVTEPGAAATARELYASWKTWCEANGEREGTQRALATRLTERGFTSSRDKHSRNWDGIGLAPCE